MNRPAVISIVTGTNSVAPCPFACAALIHARLAPSETSPPTYPSDQPQPETRPSARGRASSGRYAAMRFSPVPKKKLDNTSATTASSIASGPAKYSSAVKPTQPSVVSQSSFFLPACASAQAPTSGAVSSTAAYDTDSASVHANVAHGASPATTETK